MTGPGNTADLLEPRRAAAQEPHRHALSCRFCRRPLTQTFVDLGVSPLSNSYLREQDLLQPETFFPLCAYVCEHCFLVQLPAAESPERIFSDYAYFSSWSTSWLQHCERFAAAAVERFSLGPQSRVVEIASNDGYLLQYFRAAGISVTGVEPAANVACVAEERGIRTIVDFFGSSLARRLVADLGEADLVVGNNVLAHVPDLNDFVEGLSILCSEDGAISLEFPHLLKLIAERQFDTIYHEHFSYFSLLTVAMVFQAHGLAIFDVEELPTHGGSLRVFAARSTGGRTPTARVGDLLRREREFGLDRMQTYASFPEQVRRVKRELLSFLIEHRSAGRRIAAYGAPAKGNTLLNYCGVGRDFIEYTVDRSPHKQGRFLPGTRIPIHAPDRLAVDKPDFVIILPWNLQSEVTTSMSHVRDWGGRFVVPIPTVKVL